MLTGESQKPSPRWSKDPESASNRHSTSETGYRIFGEAEDEGDGGEQRRVNDHFISDFDSDQKFRAGSDARAC